MYMVISLALFVVVSTALFVLRKRLGLFTSAFAFGVVTILFIRFGIDPPMPGAIVSLFSGVTIAALLLYVTSSDQNQEDFWRPFHRLMTDPKHKVLLAVLMLTVPGLVAWQTYSMSLPSDTPPPRIRSVHPSPPSTIQFQGVGDEESIEVDLLGGDNPFRALETSDPDAFADVLARGKVVYYENCYYCHGDTMAADGHYAEAFKPPPADFTDPGTIAMLQEGYLFWRVAKGGPGLPNEGTPWDSSMPVWEDFLSGDDIWAVVAYLYEYTGYRPRGREDHGGGEHAEEGGH